MAVRKFIFLISLFILIVDNAISDEINDFLPRMESSLVKHRVIREESKEFKCKLDSTMTALLKFILPNPADPSPNATITLQLFTRTAPRTIIGENGKIVNIEHSDFSRERKSVIIAHGFLGSGETDWMSAMVTAYLKYEDVNVILVDWSIFSETINYVKAAKNTEEVAKQAVDLLEEIVKSVGKERPLEPIHLIGFSLGAHVVGMIARNFKAKTIWPVARITALDPAAPCFAGSGRGLNKNDAPFVDVIHTNGNKKFGATFGILQALGHIDFYVNGGEIQPGCKLSKFWSFSRLLKLSLGIKEAACSHTRAAEYFIESLKIASEGRGWPLTGIQWDETRDLAITYTYNGACTKKCLAMGITATKPEDEQLMGKYFVPTASEKPFYEIRDSDRTTISEILNATIKDS